VRGNISVGCDAFNIEDRRWLFMDRTIIPLSHCGRIDQGDFATDDADQNGSEQNIIALSKLSASSA